MMVAKQIIAYLKDKERLKAIQDADFVALVWAGCISTVDMTLTGQQLSEAIVKELKVCYMHCGSACVG